MAPTKSARSGDRGLCAGVREGEARCEFTRFGGKMRLEQGAASLASSAEKRAEIVAKRQTKTFTTFGSRGGYALRHSGAQLIFARTLRDLAEAFNRNGSSGGLRIVALLIWRTAV